MRISPSLLFIGLFAVPCGALADPTLAMMHQTGRGSAVILANDDGSGQYSIYTSRDSGAFVRPGGGTSSQHQMLLIQSNTLNLLHYSIGSKGPVADSITLLPIPAAAPALSPDGLKVFYFYNATRMFRLYTLSTGTSVDLAPLPANHGVDGAVFTRDGNSVLYYTRNVSTNVEEFYMLPVSGGTPVSVAVSGPENRSSAETALDGGFLVNNSTQTPSQYFIERYPAGGVTDTYVTPGARPSLSCNDSSIFYQLYSGGSWSIMREDLALKSFFNVAGAGYYAPVSLKC